MSGGVGGGVSDGPAHPICPPRTGVRIQHPEAPKERLSYVALRLSAKDISCLAEIAKRRGMKFSELARALISRGLEQTETFSDLEQRVVLLEKELGDVKRRLYNG